MTYQQRIAAIAGPKYQPRHIEAMMRVEHSTFDHMSPERFRSEVSFAAICVEEAGPDMAERIAQSFGL